MPDCDSRRRKIGDRAELQAGLRRVAAKAATKSAQGNIEYWYCGDCGKYFSDKAAANEISLADSVTERLTEDANDPAGTGDPAKPATGNSTALVLWFTLVLLSGSILAGTVTLRKRKRSR